MAVLSWMASGIRQKMENDITTTRALRPYFKEAFWTRNGTVPDNIPLEMKPVFPAFILLSFGLLPSIIAFFLELLYHLYEKKFAKKTSVSGLKDISKGSVPNDVITSTKRREEVEKMGNIFIQKSVSLYRG